MHRGLQNSLPTSCVCVNDQLSTPKVKRGVKQGSVLSPTLFLTVMDSLLKQESYGLSVCGTYVGAAVHADDLRTSASSKDAVTKQANIISKFAKDTCLKLNVSTLEVLRISHQPKGPEMLNIADVPITTTPTAKCLGVLW